MTNEIADNRYVLPQGYRARRFADLVSTNLTALELARDVKSLDLSNESKGLWILADRQSGGRGSRGRTWVSQEGNLFASLALRNPGPLKHLGQLTFVAVLAVRAAIADCLGEDVSPLPDIRLKWPNDVLVNGAKVSGILLENHREGHDNIIIAGIGINVVSHPEEMLYRANDLASLGCHADRHHVFQKLALRFDEFLRLWEEGKNFSFIRDLWLQHARGLGEEVVLQTGGNKDRRITGIFHDLAADGALIVKMADASKEIIHVADLFFAEDLGDEGKTRVK